MYESNGIPVRDVGDDEESDESLVRRSIAFEVSPEYFMKKMVDDGEMSVKIMIANVLRNVQKESRNAERANSGKQNKD